ncbi:PAS/PAC sensor signal transduction histidine kinase [Pirellula staleyi DSM 6068]|uniref:histidine kinase n=1 Tax=Pirellula staleyi (strain ATCC 27377 / DSM 6068 / ICPB 4128) TaxID=530564 RepID=D2R9I9_PIRSD|nr:PAS/PAC sensor signal transduction histidine kinase [Pirellula staleyi DSM 6068]
MDLDSFSVNDSTAHRALLATGTGIWKWCLVERCEHWHASLRKALEPCFSIPISDTPSLFSLLHPRSAQLLRDSLTQIERNDESIDLTLDLECSASHGTQLRLQAGIDPQDRRQVWAVCHVAKNSVGAELERDTSLDVFASIIDCAVDAIISKSVDGTIRTWNTGAEHLFGYRAEEVIGKPITLLIPPDRLNEEEDILRRIWRGERVLNFESIRRRKDGTDVNVSLTISPIKNQAGVIIGASKVVRNITEQVKTEAKLRESEERFRILFESSPTAILLSNDRAEYIDANPAYEQISGYTAEELYGKTAIDLGTLPPDSDFQTHAMEQLNATGRLDNIEVTGPTKYGNLITVLFSTREIEVAGRREFLTVLLDISERVRAEAALRKSEERLAEAQRIAHLGDWSWNTLTDEIHWSDEVYRIFGHEPKSFTPRFRHEFIQAVHAEDQTRVASAMFESLENKERFSIEHRIHQVDGTERFVRLVGQVTQDPAESAFVLLGTIQDITDLKNAEQQAMVLRNQVAHAGRIATMGEMAAGIAHELNQPLSAIELYAEGCQRALEMGVLSTEEQLSKLVEIASLADRCGEIIRRLRLFAMNRDSNWSPIDLTEVVKASIEFMGYELQKSQTRCVVQISEEPLLVSADSIELQQVFLNLIKNAIESQELSNPKDRRIEIIVKASTDKRISVIIRDNGCGMQPHQLARIFNPFYTTKSAGLGMGLKICQTIIRSLRGEIVCQSEPGVGTTFEIVLPVVRRRMK